MTTAFLLALWVFLWKLNVKFPEGMSDQEQILLRWVHFLAGIDRKSVV